MPDTPLASSDPTRSDLPDEIGAAIREFELEVWRNCAFEEGDPETARATLTAAILAILARLTAAEAEKDKLRTELWAFGEKYDAEDKRLDAEFKAPESRLTAAEAQRDAALARVERMEKALQRIAGSRMNDWDSLHPDACAGVAREALAPAPSEGDRR